MSNNLVNDISFAPPEVSSLTVSLLNERKEKPGEGVPLYISGVDGYFLPMRPGQLVTVIGRPGNYKSGLMQYVARKEAARLFREGRRDRYVAYFTWEQAIEEMTLIELANATGGDASKLAQGIVSDYDSLMNAAIKRGALPLWLFGHSVQRRSRRPRMSMNDVANVLEWVEDNFDDKPRPTLIVLDYLQRMRIDSSDPRMGYSDCVDKAKDLTLSMGAPVMLGCQAKRDVDTRRLKQPTAGDGAETANIEHTSDRILTTWMPKTSEPLNAEIPPGLPFSGKIAVIENLCSLSVAKQKLGAAGRVFPLHVEPQRNNVGLMSYYT